MTPDNHRWFTSHGYQTNPYIPMTWLIIIPTLFFSTLPILDTLQKKLNSLLVNVDIPINTKRLKD
jgi:hypothetical protein